MAELTDKPIIGQECICPDGVGRVKHFNLNANKCVGNYICVSTYMNNRDCEWAPHNVELLPPIGKS